MTLNVLPNHLDGDEQGRFPSWLHRRLPKGGNLFKTGAILEKYRLNTVCEEAKCPNRLECYTKKTATFLALGKKCTRNCGFCDIDFSKNPAPPEEDEPIRIAASVRELGLRHVVITMVARDDLPKGGALHLSEIIKEIRKEMEKSLEKVTIEVLTSDFSGDLDALSKVLEAGPEIFNHNIETVASLSPRVRHKATYRRSLEVLSYAKQSAKCHFIKSGMMVGLGETSQEVKETLDDLKLAGCDIVTIGHYLQANVRKLRVKSFITPEQFEEFAQYGRSIGLKYVASGPFIRSSYNAAEIFSSITSRT
jgi:lipoic acid synthetase